ncbi:adenine deaminase [Chloroflexota bacterium]
MSKELVDLISVARGEKAADLVLANAAIINVFSGEVEMGSVAIHGGKIAGIGDYRRAEEVIDLDGRYLAPGLINGHTHIESSMLDIGQYVRAVVARGTLAVVTDLHEFSNVCGMVAIDYILGVARQLPLDLFLMAPSCVPATHLETAGACMEAEELKKVLQMKGVIGLGEMMNFPGVINAFDNVVSKIAMAQGGLIDGHAPGLGGKDLNAYIAAGIYSDHESVTLEEAAEKLKRGMHIMIREGSSEKNLEALLPLVNDKTYKRCLLVVDDRSCADLLRDGDINAVVRKAIKLGLEPVRAIQLATINPAEYFGLKGLGAVAPGYAANLIVVDNLSDFNIEKAFYKGKLVADGGKALFETAEYRGKKPVNTVDIKPFSVEGLKLIARGDSLPVIGVVPGQIITRKIIEKIEVVDGVVMPDTERDLLKLVVVERHKASGNIGIGLVRGFGLKRGALASSIAHDSHNVIAVGTSDADIYAAVRHIEKIKGGLVVVADGKVLADLPLPIGGLLSDQPLEEVVAQLERLKTLALELGSQLQSPFATLSFMALPVIPELRLTDLGLVDVGQFKIID